MAHDQWIGRGDRGEAAASTQVAHAPDFVRHDRGDADDNWAHAFGAPCARCGRLLEESDMVRRRGTGDWVHQSCPVSLTPDEV
jgi:hypothetical protein